MKFSWGLDWKELRKFEKNPSFILENGIIPSELFQSSICMISD